MQHVTSTLTLKLGISIAKMPHEAQTVLFAFVANSAFCPALFSTQDKKAFEFDGKETLAGRSQHEVLRGRERERVAVLFGQT